MNILIFSAVLLLYLSTSATASGGLLLGLWKTEGGDGVVEFYKCDQEYCGRFYSLKDDSLENPSLDDKNPDPAKRSRRLCGLTFMGGFHSEDQRNYTGGWIYSPRHGAMFSADIVQEADDTIRLRGYVLTPILGADQIWFRVTGVAACASIAVPNT